MNAIVPFTGNQVAKPLHGGAVGTPITPAVKQAMREIIVCYAAPGETTEDRALVIGVWARETAEYPPEIVEAALRHILRHNRRAPWRPCPKDIIDRCEWEVMQAKARIQRWYRGSDCQRPPAWCEPLVREAVAFDLSLMRARVADYQGRAISKGESCVSDKEWIAWKLAQEIGPRLDQWPTDLLDEYGVAYGAELDRIAKTIAAAHAQWEEEKRREAEKKRQYDLRREAEDAAARRTNVAAARQRFDRVNVALHPHSTATKPCTKSEWNAYLEVWKPALAEELAARGLTEEPF